MEFTTLNATSRGTGKRAAKDARLQGLVPCVLYGHHVEPVAFKIDARSIESLVRSHETPLVKIDIEKDSWDCILKDVSYHPVEDTVMHADFQVLQPGEKISLSVPFHFEGTPAGQIEGGNTQYVLSEVEISCLPKDIPPYLTVDISALNIGESIHIGDLSFEGFDFEVSDSQTVVMIHAPRVSKAAADEEAEGAEGEAEEAAE